MEFENIINLDCDAVIVLANEMDASGVLNEESSSRLKKAVDIYKSCNASYLVTCGWAYRPDSEIRVGDALRDYAVKYCGVSPRNILVEGLSRDTVGDAFFTKRNLALPYLWRRICVVTSDYHVARTKKIFEFIYGNEYSIFIEGAELTSDLSKVENELKSTRAFEKTFMGIESGDDDSIYIRIRGQHPYYNGSIYNKI